ncbi:MAG: rod shape-determining protein RodA [Alphaproteobacteria bacterium]|nr:rod shape-determining protein RodA [Alphaproteobacteria bacterium]
MSTSYSRQFHFPFTEKLKKFNFPLFFGVLGFCAISLLLLYSVGMTPCETADCTPTLGNFRPFALKQGFRFLIGFGVFFSIAFSHIGRWLKYAYILYGINILLLLLVTIIGHTGMGAQRWISIGGFIFQPSEPMKITLVLALSRYFSSANVDKVKSIGFFLGGLALVLLPFLLVVSQPDLGTALILTFIGGGMLFISGMPLSRFLAIFLAVVVSLPVIWQVGLKDYQKQRVLTFISPDKDSAGAGYHISQSKIALGSGGWVGKGYMKGSQSHLNFLPEKQTDFIFTMFAEEFGFIGSFLLLILFGFVIFTGFMISFRARSRFSNLLGVGLMINFFLYLFINIAMVTGVIPVVGVPLPLISYGGSSALSLLVGFGLLQSVAVHRDMLVSSGN